MAFLLFCLLICSVSHWANCFKCNWDPTSTVANCTLQFDNTVVVKRFACGVNRTIANGDELMDGETIEVECASDETTIGKTTDTTQFLTCQRDDKKYVRVNCYRPCNTSTISNLNNNTMLSPSSIVGVGQQLTIACQENFASLRTTPLDITCSHESSTNVSSLSALEVDIEDMCYGLPLIEMVPFDSESVIKMKVSMDMSFDRSFDQAFDSVLKGGWCRLNKTDDIPNSDLNGTGHFMTFDANPLEPINYLNISNSNLTYGSPFNMTCGLNWSNLKMDPWTGLEVNFEGRMNPPALEVESGKITLKSEESMQIELAGTNLATLKEWYPSALSFLIELSIDSETVWVHDLAQFTVQDGGSVSANIDNIKGVISIDDNCTVTVTSLRDGKKGGASSFTAQVSSSMGMARSFFVVPFLLCAWFIAY